MYALLEHILQIQFQVGDIEWWFLEDVAKAHLPSIFRNHYLRSLWEGFPSHSRPA
jgi:hypothetical protein